MNTNLGDAAFDAIKIYKTLFEEIGFQKAFIPLKTKLTIEGIDYTVNENGIPCCPHDPSKVKKLSLMIFTYRLLTKQRHILWIFSHKARAGNQIFRPFGNIH